ncbi:MAG: NADH-quinone oxidoreductase subunit A [Candidatus Micrarchaeaceae archaeon]
MLALEAAVLASLSILIPILMLVAYKLLGYEETSNLIKNDNYESAEKSEGGRFSIMSEYLHYFPMFIMYEIVVAIAIIWAFSSSKSVFIIYLLLLSFAYEIAIMLLSKWNSKMPQI